MNLVTHPKLRKRGIALIIVMICIAVLAILAAGFAYSMKVETRLAMNVNAEGDMLAIGIGSINKAIALLNLKDPSEPFDALNQKWAGGPGSSATSNLLAVVTLDPNTKIEDMERRANINMADERLLNQAMTLLNVDAADSGPITSSILDWIDPDKNEHPNGTETEYYETLVPPYKCKDGPIDDIAELLLVRGVTEEIFDPKSSNNKTASAYRARSGLQPRDSEQPVNFGLVDLFCPLSAGLININTASREVLQMILNGDEAAADRIIACRAGPDGADGTGDDVPFRSPGEGLQCAQIPSQMIPQIAGYFSVRSRLFQVEVHAEVNGTHRYFYAIVDRDASKILTFFWKHQPIVTSLNRNADAR